MKWILFLIVGVLSLLTGCASERNGDAEEMNQEVEVQEVMSKELEVDFQVIPLSKETQFIISLTNQSDQLKKLEFHSSQKYEIIVTNDKGEEIFTYSRGKMFSQALETALLKSGENMEWEETWKHDPLPPGQYKAKVSILSHKSDNLSLEREWTVPPNN
ncbi:BsuPI-related putative proteinase inhibitor [Metabacillus halosaccharovorans]|uniref:BsuPI-related putative proteinase inhibitor n=1 Tax=Metabacillus halosaccharovorans TaxID=930124 RepID=UPI003736EADA